MIRAYLYDANGGDRAIETPKVALPELADHQLLWIDVVGREADEIAWLQKLFDLRPASAHDLARSPKALTLNNYGTYFHCDVTALAGGDGTGGGAPKVNEALRLDLLVGPNWLISVADAELPFLREFRDQDRGESLIGSLSSASLAAALLDGHLTKYLSEMEELEAFVDRLDVRMLGRRSVDDHLLAQVVAGRRFVARLRRMLAPQRSIFYGLSRPDFALIADANAADHFKSLENRFERTIDTVEHGRELVQGSFDLFTTRIAETTNVLIRRLTYLSLSLGAVGAVAGIFGMNFETPYTKSGAVGFWMVIAGLVIVIAAGGIVARLRQWL